MNLRSCVAGVTSIVIVALTASASAQFRPVAVYGDPVPDQPGVTLERTIAVSALGGNRAAYKARTSNADDIIAIDDGSGTDTTIAVQRQPAPGGGTYGQLSAPLAAGSAFAFKSTNAGVETVFVWSAATGVRRVIASGDVLPTTRTLGTMLEVKFNVLGQVAVTNSIDTVVVEPNGTVRGIAHVGGPVPGDTGRVINYPMGNVWLSDAGDLTFSVSADGPYAYVLHGPPGNLAIVESDRTLNMTGNVGAVAASRSGLIAYTVDYSTGTGPTVAHHVLKVGAAGAATEVMHLVDTLTFTVDGRTVQTNYLTPVLHPMTGLIMKSNVGILRNSGGAWSKIHFNDEGLPGTTMAQPLEISTLGTGGHLILTGFAGGTAAIYQWTSTGGLELVVKAGDVFAGIGTLTDVKAGEFAVSDDGQIAFIVGHAAPGGQNGSSAYLSGNPSGATADLAIDVTSTLRSYSEAFLVGSVTFHLINNGPDPGTPGFTVVTDFGTFDVTGCFPVGRCSCTGGNCTFREPLYAGGDLLVFIDAIATRDPTQVTISLMSFDSNDPDPSNNTATTEIEAVTEQEGCGVFGCSTRTGSSGVFVGLALASILLRRRRRC